MGKKKVVVLGESSVGKSCLIERATRNTFSNQSVPTVGASQSCLTISTPNGMVTLDIWDTAGQEKYRALTPMYYRGADVVIICFDVTNRSSYEAVLQWSDVLQENLPKETVIVLCATKIDLEDDRIISSDELNEMGFRCFAAMTFETSAQTGQNVKEMFNAIAEIKSPSEDTQQEQEVYIQNNPPVPQKKCC